MCEIIDDEERLFHLALSHAAITPERFENPQLLLGVLQLLIPKQDVAFLVVEVLNECSCLSGVSTIGIVGTVAERGDHVCRT